MDIYRRWAETTAQEQKPENRNLAGGGPKPEREAHAIALRRRAGANEQGGAGRGGGHFSDSHVEGPQGPICTRRRIGLQR
eukprot:9476813-Alexandrium_andersonii.AAC.1